MSDELGDTVLVNGETIRYDLVPVEYMVDGLRRYFERRVPETHMGGFMLALLRGDLFEAVARADMRNLVNLQEWCRWLYNYAPAGSYGSPENVKAWLQPKVKP